MIAQRIYEYKKGLKEAERFLQSKTFHDDRFKLLEKIASEGGHFAKKLGDALWIADANNYHIAIKSFWHIFKPYIKKELYEVAESVCKCGDTGVYTALETITTICKSKGKWVSEADRFDAEFRCSECDGLMPKEIATYQT